MGLIQGATPASAAVSRTGPVDLTGALWAYTRRIKWADAGAIAGSQTFFGAGGLTIVWDGTSKFTVTIPGSTPGVTEFTVPAPSAATEYDLVICYNTLLAYGFWRATSAGSAGLSTSTATPVSDTEVVSPTSLAGATWYFGNTSALATGSEDTSRDSALFVGAVLSDADIELFGKGAAPFQLTSSTLRMSPADIGGTVRDRYDGATMTASGTAAVNTAANFDGPLWDIDSATLPSEVSTSILARYDARYCIRDTTGTYVREVPDVSGGGAHQAQTTDANRPRYTTIDGHPSIVFYCTAVAAQFLNTRTGGGTGAGRVSSTGTAISQALVGGSQAPLSDTAAWLQLMMYMTNTSAANPWSMAFDNGRKFGVYTTTNSATADTMYLPVNHSFALVCYDGTAGANNVSRRVDDQIDQLTQANTASTRYMYGLGYSAAGNPAASFFFHECAIWTADKRATATSNAIAAHYRGKWTFMAKPWGIAVLGTSSEVGQDAVKGNMYLRELGHTINNQAQVMNFSIGGKYLGDSKFTVATTGGTANATPFVAGETITQDTTGATAKFLSEGGNQVYIYDFAGGTAFVVGANELVGGTSGARRVLSAAVTNSTRALASTSIQSTIVAFFTNVTHTKRAIVLNTSSNGLTATNGVVASEIAGVTALVTKLRAAVPSGTRIGCRMHQPRSGGTETLHATFLAGLQTLLTAGTIDFVVDPTVDTAFDTYVGSSDYGNTDFYTDNIHMNDAGHIRMGNLVRQRASAIMGIGTGGVASYLPALMDIIESE